MSTFRLTTIEEFEAATQRILETGAKVGADSWQARVKNQDRKSTRLNSSH